MRALFDVNFLIAIVDTDREDHIRAHAWWAENISSGWATCPLTENGMVRIMSQSRYKSAISTTFAMLRNKHVEMPARKHDNLPV